MKAGVAKYKAANPEKVKARRAKYCLNNADKLRDDRLRYKYGIGIDEYDRLLLQQGNKCYICWTKKCSTGRRFAVDHDHKTGKVRGLLCRDCNKGIGLFKDNPSFLSRAAAYVELS